MSKKRLKELRSEYIYVTQDPAVDVWASEVLKIAEKALDRASTLDARLRRYQQKDTPEECPCDTCTLNDGYEEECQGMAMADRRDCSYGYLRWLAAKTPCEGCRELPTFNEARTGLTCKCQPTYVIYHKWLAQNGGLP